MSIHVAAQCFIVAAADEEPHFIQGRRWLHDNALLHVRGWHHRADARQIRVQLASAGLETVGNDRMDILQLDVADESIDTTTGTLELNVAIVAEFSSLAPVTDFADGAADRK